MGPIHQRGVAIISVLLTVALAAIIVSGLFLREHVTIRSVENRLALTQTRWVERAAIDWSKVILAADKRTSPQDHLGEAWAVPVAETKLDETVTAGARIDDEARAATLTGQMFDAQARFNLNTLVQVQPDGTTTVAPERLEMFKRLLGYLGQPESLADTITARVLAAEPARLNGESPAPRDVLPLVRLPDLATVRGVNAETLEALEPFVTFLPAFTPINVNTAPAEILAAAVPELDIAAARQLVTRRERTFFTNLADFRAQITPAPEKLDERVLSVETRFFLVRGLIRFGRVESFSETLLERTPQRVTVIWQRRL
ncbi:MAG: type II secretion system minor pseudopilin GspK [Burkholderiaceae bacterium]